MIQAIKGTKDILPDEILKWHQIEKVFRDVSSSFNYYELRTPIFEKTEVFSRSIGEETDIVNKEMYTFEDKGGNSITLRPEKTAALVRAVIQNSLLQQGSILKLWYFGPFFRYERPQKGRLRQFHQYGAECIGSPHPEADVEMIMLADSLFSSAGIGEYTLLLNTLGNSQSRAKYREEIYKYFKSNLDKISGDSKNRLDKNPLRILDSKDERDLEIIKKAPSILEHLDNESNDHFERVKFLLDSAGIKYEPEPRLVRGLDYYNHTVFEFRSSKLGAQDSFGGGGRYDGLFEQLGGKPTPAVGFALGVERMLLILEANKFNREYSLCPDIYFVTADLNYFPEILKISDKLRKKGVFVTVDVLNRSVKAQFRDANRLKAKYTAAFGENEFKSGTVKIKEMDTGEETEIGISSIDEFSFK